MRLKKPKASLIRSGFAASLLLLASASAMAQSTVTLTAAPATTTLPDGQGVPMWGLMCGTFSGTTFTYVPGSGATCTTMTGGVPNGTWQPPLITIASGQPLAITLINNLHVPIVPA